MKLTAMKRKMTEPTHAKTELWRAVYPHRECFWMHTRDGQAASRF